MSVSYYKNIKEIEFASYAKDDPKKEYLETYMSNDILAFKLSTGEIIANHKGYCLLVQNIEDLDKYVAKISEEFGSDEILFNKNPWKDKFPDKESLLINELLNELTISGSNNGLELLEEIDKRIAKLERPELFKEEYFLNIIAIVGATINIEKGTSWKMLLSEDKVTWHPYILYNEEKIEFVRYLYEDLFINAAHPYPLSECYLTVEGIIELNLSE